MIEETGIVTGRRENELEVSIVVPGDCENCGVKDSCYAVDKHLLVPAKDDISVNDRVRVVVRDLSVLKITAFVYGLPLVFLLAGVLAGYYLFFAAVPENPRILATAGITALFFIVSGFIVSKIDKRLKHKMQFDIEKINSYQEHKEANDE
jgi:positive regulator of sigma E activity